MGTRRTWTPNDKRRLLRGDCCIGILALTVLVLLLTGCGGQPASTPAQSPTTPSTMATSTPTTSLARHHTPGEVAETPSQLALTIGALTSTTTNGGSTVDAGKTWLVVEVTAKNTGTEEQEFNPWIDFTLRNAGGTSFSSVAGIGEHPYSLVPTRVSPGQTVRGQVAFEIPLGEHAFNLYYAPTNSDAPQTTWDITAP